MTRHDRGISRRMNRRQLLAGAVAAGIAPTAFSGSVLAQNAAVTGQITLMAYAGIFQDNYTRTVVEPFQKAFPNVKVNYAAGGTSARRE